jgi:hypothetical protein
MLPLLMLASSRRVFYVQNDDLAGVFIDGIVDEVPIF